MSAGTSVAGGYLEMEDGTVIEVAVRRKDELMVRLGLSPNV
jgi:hypothetical protein